MNKMVSAVLEAFRLVKYNLCDFFDGLMAPKQFLVFDASPETLKKYVAPLPFFPSIRAFLTFS